MSDNHQAPGNPHIYAGPQIAAPDTINEQHIAEQGVTDHTMLLSELTRNTEATLAVAFEARTANLISVYQEAARRIESGYYATDADKARILKTHGTVTARLGLGADSDE